MNAQIVCDFQAVQNEPSARRGLGRYATEHARALARCGAIRALLLNPVVAAPPRLDIELSKSGLVRWNTAASIRQLADRGPFAYLVMSPFELQTSPGNVVSHHTIRGDIPLLVMLYDLVPLVMPHTYLDNEYKSRRYRARLELLRAADVLLALSERSKQDAMRYLGISDDRIVVIGAGVSQTFSSQTEDEATARIVNESVPDIRGPFVLSVSGGDERKNTERLLEAWALLDADLRSSMQLVIVGFLYRSLEVRWRKRCRELGLSADEVVFTDWVSDAALAALYRSAQLFVFPSLYEGFGLPVAEAAAAGCPVITSDPAPIPEILDFRPSVFDARDVGAMSACIERGIRDDEFRASLIRAAQGSTSRHTWEQVASRTVRALERVEWDEWRVPRRRVAFCGRFGGRDDGLSEQNREVVAAIATDSDVDVFWTDRHRPASAGSLSAFRPRPLSALERAVNPASYDAIVYSLDAPQRMKFPGIAWYHRRVRVSRARHVPRWVRRALAAVVRVLLSDAAANFVAREPSLLEKMPPRAIVGASEGVLPQDGVSASVIVRATNARVVASQLTQIIDGLAPILPDLGGEPNEPADGASQ